MMTKDEWIRAAKLLLWDLQRSGDYPWSADSLRHEARMLFHTIEQIEHEDKRATDHGNTCDHVEGRFSNDALCREGV